MEPQERINQNRKDAETRALAREREANANALQAAKLEAFMGEGLNLYEADFLDPEAARYIAGLVSSHTAAGNRPMPINRNTGKRGRWGHQKTEQIVGYMLVRKETEGVPGGMNEYDTVIHPVYMIVTPDLSIVSWNDNDISRNPAWLPQEFDTEVIVRSVVEQLAGSGTDWVEPSA